MNRERRGVCERLTAWAMVLLPRCFFFAFSLLSPHSFLRGCRYLSRADHAGHAAPSRVMGFRDLVLFYVVTGISLRWIATAATHGPSSLVIWLAAWVLLYIPLALAVIHLSTRFPAEGGFYVWIKKAFGERAGFLSAWLYWVSNLPYFPAVLYFAASNLLFLHPALHHYSQKPIFFMGFAILVLSGLTILNILGLNLAKWAHNLGAIAMWVPALIVIALGLLAWKNFGSATSFTPRSLVPTAHVEDMLFWPVIIFAFIGCETASLMAEEIKDARRDIPRALLLAGATIAFCYMLGTFCVLLAIPSSQSSNLDGLAQAIAQTAERLRLSGITGLGVFLGQAGASVGGAYDVLVAICVVITMIPFALIFASLIRLRDRTRSPDDATPATESAAFTAFTSSRAFPASLLGVVGLFTATLAIGLSLIPPQSEPHKVLYFFKLLGSSGALIALGLLVFQLGRRST